MKRLAIAVAAVAALAVIVGELGDLTQSRPDPVQADAVTEIVLAVDRTASRPARTLPQTPCGVCAPGRRDRRSPPVASLAPIAGGALPGGARAGHR